MKLMARIVLLALLLQVTTASQVAVLAQRAKPAASATQYKEELKAFDEFVARQMKFDKTPGLIGGFMKDDFVWVKGYGFSDFENKVPAKAESAYRLASVTKPMTAVAIMQLVEKKRSTSTQKCKHMFLTFPGSSGP